MQDYIVELCIYAVIMFFVLIYFGTKLFEDLAKSASERARKRQWEQDKKDLDELEKGRQKSLLTQAIFNIMRERGKKV